MPEPLQEANALLEHEPQALQSSPTSKSELWGWYSYGWASEPYVVSAVGTFIPILLEQFARDRGVRLEDHAVPCGSPLPGSGANATLPGPPGEIGDPTQAQVCVVRLFGTHFVNTSSFALYTFSASVLVQTLVVISMSGAADRGKFRKNLLVWFAVVGAVATCLFVFLDANHYIVASLLTVISNACYGAVSVCGNAFLSVLVNSAPETLAVGQEIEFDPLDEDGQRPEGRPELVAVTSQVSNKLSGTGVALGYLAALIVQVLLMGFLAVAGSSTFSIQITVFVVGLWWLVFQIPVVVFLRSRPGPPLPLPKNHGGNKHKINHFLNVATGGAHYYIIYGWKTLFATFREARRMKDVALFLLGWFLVSDAFTTINSAAILFARSELQMEASALAVVSLLVVVWGIVGATLSPRYIIPRFASRNPMLGVMFVVALGSVVPLYGILGFFTHFIGLRHPWEMYLLACWYGFSAGGLSTLCRSNYSLLIPRGKEGIFFSLFSVTDKGSSIIGPFITGLITDKTHNIRYTFYFLFVLMVIPLGVFYMVDVERGTRDARCLEEVEVEFEG